MIELHIIELIKCYLLLFLLFYYSLKNHNYIFLVQIRIQSTEIGGWNSGQVF